MTATVPKSPSVAAAGAMALLTSGFLAALSWLLVLVCGFWSGLLGPEAATRVGLAAVAACVLASPWIAAWMMGSEAPRTAAGQGAGPAAS